MKIKQAVIPAAGRGKQLLPVTKNVAKELLPLFDRPCIQHVIEEAIEAGVEEFIIVVSKDKQDVKSYFEPDPSLEEWLVKNNHKEILKRVKKIETKAKYTFVVQEELLGLGHAVLCAKPYVTEDYFFVLLPDDIIDAEKPVCQQMGELFAETGTPVVTVMEVPWDDVHRYGIVKADPLSEKLGQMKSIIEKPRRKTAPSNLAVIGRYLLPKDIFTFIEAVPPSPEGEIELTDALRGLMATRPVNSFLFSGERYDAGTPLGLVMAGMVMALKNPAAKEKVSSFIKILASSV
ncbi:MAG: UTP--glucose-1-phosphate uridylyltransferase [Deltaproteobacteria bacterium]|nr:UTP--glucose-1-phosphate uridylyltransferase [Deltaproteobacteria bacterium]